MNIYMTLLMLHISAAVIGLGPTFLYPFLISYAKEAGEIKFVTRSLGKLSLAAKIGDYTLLVTGCLMVALGYWSFTDFWVLLSLFLFAFMRFSSSVLSKKSVMAIWGAAEKYEGAKLEKVYDSLKRKFVKELWLTQGINFAIILVMVLKP